MIVSREENVLGGIINNNINVGTPYKFESVNSFKYLGTLINSKNNMHQNTKRSIMPIRPIFQ